MFLKCVKESSDSLHVFQIGAKSLAPGVSPPSATVWLPARDNFSSCGIRSVIQPTEFRLGFCSYGFDCTLQSVAKGSGSCADGCWY
jgi:hypothetical protein